jgi:cystathionine beta-lyase
MNPDFDRIVDRRDTDSLKWKGCADRNLLPMWVADMDFASPPCVVEALRRRVDQAVFGYAIPTDALNQAIVQWAATQYDWPIQPEWIEWLPGLVPGLHVACLAYAQAGAEVLTQVPVYPPFLTAPKATGRVLKTVPLAHEERRWSLNLPALAQAVSHPRQLLMLCHPHNPVGRAYTREELHALADVCERHDLIVCSDEIHCDLMLDPRPHVPFASLGEAVAQRTVTLMSPAKTFNTPGLSCGFAVISNAELRRKFRRAAAGIVPHPNALGYAACHAAYTAGNTWRLELLDYLRGNRDCLSHFLAERLPMFSLSDIEATYLAWLDTRWLAANNNESFFEDAGVKLSGGHIFHGPGYMRLNFGCPRATLLEGLERIERAVQRVA